MNLDKLFDTQKVLRDRIGYEGEDRFEKLILALLVEVGECANEWRGFKFWSKDQEPRTKVMWGYEETHFGSLSTIVPNFDKPIYKNRLLEEYVDGLHFVLELGIELENVVTVIKVYDWQPKQETRGEVNRQFAKVYLNASLLFEDDYYREMQFSYLKLGEMLGFTWEEVEAAYFEKNKINHERQENGY